jgi:ABC-type sugar transport system substrate-binding protein
VGPDDHKLGVQSAELLIEGLNSSGVGLDGSVVMVTGTPGASSTIARSDGFTETLAQKAPTLRLVGQQPGNWDQTQATTAAARLFSQYGNDNIVGLYANADNMLAGALVAAERSGYRPGENLIATGSDCTAEGYTNIKAGTQFGTNLQDPIADGKTIAGLAADILSGNEVPKTTFIDTPMIRMDNVEQCAAALG